MLHRVAPHVMKGRWMARIRYPSSPSAPRSAWNNEWRRHMRSMTAADLLNVAGVARSQKASVVSEDDTLVKAVETMAAHHNSSTLVVVDTEDRVVGLLTQHRILTQISQHLGNWPSTLVKDAALPSRDIVHVTPEDTLQDCRAVMALTGRGELPVLSGDSLLGIISLTDIASLLVKNDSQNDGEAHSAKSDYVHLILPRKGLPKNTSLAPSVAMDDKDIPQFVLHSFAMSIPHPQKVESGGEDAFFLGTVGTPDNCGADVLCFGVSDGVGSWFEQGFSASKYSRELMKAAQAAATVSLTKHPHVNPSEVLHAAWQNVSQQAIMGSATACVVALDPVQAELYAVNLGDSGFLIIRDKKSDLKTAEKRGTLDGSLTRKMKNRDTDLTPAGRRKGAHVSYRSPQQLHYFNCPFQLGYYVPDIPDGSAGPLFETPREAVNLRVPVEEGDLIILATDGLFDNVDEDQLLEIVAAEPDGKEG
ncbi:hypothetical protein, variant 1 [Aphanomyces astaci]|uniref:Protein phosphatase n=1 Tax=Aphanomyces astaci TaxID=112090 RepID=W4FJL5_APHAT|nr:hypothetical protein, variant 1 [Aphanomyces astaci]ETV67665.1 hypothetical protein, variant 1 [Aphanomyces astaci]|eukprot:XP_009842922.1 hypothetical protein, variant 1 [Aphanomyces astaci]